MSWIGEGRGRVMCPPVYALYVFLSFCRCFWSCSSVSVMLSPFPLGCVFSAVPRLLEAFFLRFLVPLPSSPAVRATASRRG